MIQMEMPFVSTPMVHSKIGASTMSRWSKCPASVRLSQGVPETKSKYAEEGTKAHDIAANILLGKPAPSVIDVEMLEAIQVYVDYVESLPKDNRQIEQRFNLEKIHPGLFGTSDAVVYHPKTQILEVIDYKHGAGLGVEAANNPQLMYYGLGSLLTLNLPVKTVRLTIVQPRCEHKDGPIRSWDVDAVELLDFAVDLKAYAIKTESPDAPVVLGDHCRFCPAGSMHCPKKQEKAVELAKNIFSSDLPYEPKKLSEILEWLPTFEAWISSVNAFAYAEAERGRVPPGYKLVDKRATRKWRDEEQVARYVDKLDSLGELKAEECFQTKILSVAQLEKTIGKKKFENDFLEHVVQESSGTVLVPLADKRQEVSPKLSVEEVFKAKALN